MIFPAGVSRKFLSGDSRILPGVPWEFLKDFLEICSRSSSRNSQEVPGNTSRSCPKILPGVLQKFFQKLSGNSCGSFFEFSSTVARKFLEEFFRITEKYCSSRSPPVIPPEISIGFLHKLLENPARENTPFYYYT